MTADLIAGAARVLCGCQARWSDAPPSPGPRVYYANHSSHLDAPVIWASLPVLSRRSCRIVAASDYWDRGPLRRWLARRVFRAVLIDRTHVTRDSNPLNSMLEALDAGDALIIFPEGTRGTGIHVAEFQAGLWHLARKRPETSFTPVWLENLSRVLPKGEFLPVPIMTAVSFGADVALTPGESRDEFLLRLRSALQELGDQR